ncbi:MAG: 3-hydroxybutyryl-CoA dehydrogenase [Chitinophagales bacterium]|nr:MAG: 3-hydroxybutyryl-CoA dehydrogenase [Chitinophagales bacterium]
MNKICVIGGGTMGNGITHVFAQNGFQVSLVDVSQQALDKALATIRRNLDRMVAKGTLTEEKKTATLTSISVTTRLEEGAKDAELVIEAVSENTELKLSLFRKLDALCSPDTILASNTSSISITRIAAATQRPEKVIGMHFMNPVPIMKLVEVICGYGTAKSTKEAILQMCMAIGKTPVVVQDYPGFVSNRILMPMINEAIITLHEGVAGVAEIDTVMKLGMAHPMGPLQLADFIGLDVCLAILRVLHEGLGNPKYAPCPLLVNMVTSGNLGVKTGEGFYNYNTNTIAPTKELQVSERFRNYPY